MIQQEKAEYTARFLRAEFRFAIDQAKWAKNGWVLVKVEKYPDSWLFRPFRIVATYQREKSDIEFSEG